MLFSALFKFLEKTVPYLFYDGNTFFHIINSRKGGFFTRVKKRSTGFCRSGAFQILKDSCSCFFGVISS